jgi:biopolymer transport protein ExbD
MNCARFVCLLALSLSATANHAAAQTPPMTRGISVQMPETRNAATYADADNANAWIVAVTVDGQLYLGPRPVTPEQLFEEMKATPRQRDAKLYIKADARSTFSSLKAALGPARSAQFENVVFLTSQPGSYSHSATASPQGINVEILPQKKEAIDVHLSSQAEASQVIVNGKAITWLELGRTLKNLVRGPGEVVVVEANDAVPFADVIRVLDEARKTGARLAVPSYHSL